MHRPYLARRIAVVLLAILVLAPAWQQLTLAQAEPEETAQATETPPEPTVPPDPVPTEIPSQPTEAPTEPPATEAEATEPPQPTAQAPPPKLSDIHNDVHVCPAGYEPADLSQAAFLADCPDPGEGFTLSVSAPAYPGQAGASGPDGIVIFTGVPTITVHLGQEPRDGYLDPYVFCAAGAAPQPVATPGRAFAYALTAPNVACSWFNIPIAVDDPGTPEDAPTASESELEVFKYVCPEGYDPTGATLDDLLAACEQPGAGITFSLTGGGYGQKATTDAAGSATFPDIPAGKVALAELTGGDYEVVVSCFPTAGGLRVARDVPLQGPVTGPIGFEIPGDAIVTGQDGPEYTCYVFNIPLPSSGLTVYKFFCPPDVMVDPGTDLEYALENCPDVAPDIEFAVTADGYEARGYTESNGEVTFLGIPTGVATIEEVTPPGYGEPVAWCSWTAVVDDAVFDALPQQLATESGALELELSFPGTEAVCYWFNIPLSDDLSEVTFVKHLCPEGIDVATATLESLLADCTEPGVGVGFAFAAVGYEQVQRTGDDGTVTFSGVPFGRFTVEENRLDGYGDAIVYCGWTAPTPGGGEIVASPVEVPIAGFNLDLEIPAPGSVLTCDWFNIAVPSALPSLRIVAHQCPPGAEIAQGPLDLADMQYHPGFEDALTACPDLVPNASFTVSASGARMVDQTGKDGRATFTDLPGKTISVTGGIVDGHEPPVVYCGWSQTAADGSVSLPFYVQAPISRGAITLDISRPNTTHACHWFTIPPPPGQIDMHVAICPPGYTFESFDITDLGDCLPGERDVTFTATDGASYTETPAGSGSDGSWRVFFDNVPVDTPITITRDVASGEGAPFATCDQGNGVLNVVPADSGIQTTVETPSAGAPFERCIWFTVPSDEPGEVTIDTHACPDGALDPETATHDDFLAACTTPGAGITFHVYDTWDSELVLYDETDASGHLAWEGEVGQIFSVLEEVPDGYGEPVVFCTYGSAAVPGTTWERQPTESGGSGYAMTSAFPLAPGYTWACHWFNVPVEGGGEAPTGDLDRSPSWGVLAG